MNINIIINEKELFIIVHADCYIYFCKRADYRNNRFLKSESDVEIRSCRSNQVRLADDGRESVDFYGKQ